MTFCSNYKMKIWQCQLVWQPSNHCCPVALANLIEFQAEAVSFHSFLFLLIFLSHQNIFPRSKALLFRRNPIISYHSFRALSLSFVRILFEITKIYLIFVSGESWREFEEGKMPYRPENELKRPDLKGMNNSFLKKKTIKIPNRRNAIFLKVFLINFGGKINKFTLQVSSCAVTVGRRSATPHHSIGIVSTSTGTIRFVRFASRRFLVSIAFR